MASFNAVRYFLCSVAVGPTSGAAPRRPKSSRPRFLPVIGPRTTRILLLNPSRERWKSLRIIEFGSASELVFGPVFKTGGGSPSAAPGGFDSHALPPHFVAAHRARRAAGVRPTQVSRF